MAGRRIEMSVESVRVHVLSTSHVVILKELSSDRYLPIWIGPWEANAIATRLQGVSPDRPLTHDLLVAAVGLLGAQVREVLVVDLADDTFHARLVVEDAAGARHEIDARPSDAIAVAVRTGVRIFADEDVLARAGVRPEPAAEGERRGGPGTRRGAPGDLPQLRQLARRGRGAEGRPEPALTRAVPGAPGSRPAGQPAPGVSSTMMEPRRSAVRAVRPQPEPRSPEVLHRAPDHGDLRAGRRARRSRVVRDADLGEGMAAELVADQHLRREEGAPGLDPEPAQGVAPEELAGAVDVADPEAEEDPVGELVGARVDGADDRVRPLDPEPDHRVRRVGRRDPRDEEPEIGDPELAVTVREADELMLRRPEARPEGGTVALVDLVGHDPEDPRVGSRELGRDLAGPVLRAIVDGDDLERLGDRRERRQRLLHQRGEVRLLVVRREEVGERGDARRRRLVGSVGH